MYEEAWKNRRKNRKGNTEKKLLKKPFPVFIPENISKAIYTIPTAQLFKLW